MKKLKKTFAVLMATMMLSGLSAMSAFAETPDDPAGLKEFSEKYGVTMEYVGEREGVPVYKTDDWEKIDKILDNQEFDERDACNHDWFYIWKTRTETCIRNSRNEHTVARKLEKCNKCGVIMNTGEWEIWDCPSGCRKSDYIRK